MYKRKVFKLIGIVLLVAWIIVTIIAYYQHRRSEEVYVVGRYVEFEDYGILVKDVEIYDDESCFNYNDNYKVFNWLPQKIAYKVFRLMYFYSMTTDSLEGGPEYVVNCEIITEDGNKFNMQEQDLRIVMYDALPVGNYAYIGSGSESSNISNSVEYRYRGKWSDKDYQGLSLKDYNTGEVIVIPFTEPSITKTYTFGNPKNNLFHNIAADMCDRFIYSYMYRSKEAALEYIYEGQIDGIDWSSLDQVSSEGVSRYELSYEFYNAALGDVFNMLVETEDVQTLIFEMIYEDEQWWILDFEMQANDTYLMT